MIGLIILPFYIILNYYLFSVVVKWTYLFSDFLKNNFIRKSILIIIMFLSSSLFLSLFIPDGKLKALLNILGNYWLGIIVYSLLLLLIVFLFKVIFKNLTCLSNIIIGIVCIVSVISLNVYGIINARIIHTKRYSVTVNKKANKINSLNIVMIADLHIGYNIGYNHIKNMVSKINKENADIVIISGDIFDNNYSAIDKPNKIADELKHIKSKYGVYAVYGNHDVKEKVLFGFTFNKKHKLSDDRMDKLLRDANIKLLDDNYILLNDSIYIYGRIDYSSSIKRKSPTDIKEEINTNKPIIVVDHQPKELIELSKIGVDLDLSGHTHDGQIFPGNLICKLFYKNSYGLKKFGNMTSIVTSGVGLFGPNMRVMTDAEITVINVKFK